MMDMGEARMAQYWKKESILDKDEDTEIKQDLQKSLILKYLWGITTEYNKQIAIATEHSKDEADSVPDQ